MTGDAPPAQPDLPARSLFADVVGQESAVETLRAAARHPVHAYLFSGQPGAGARAATRSFGAALLCPHGGCGRCGACRRALAGTHPDLVVVERSGAAIGVEEARRLVALSMRRPFEASRQVLVVSDAHLAARAVPALLKAVEEPPSSTVWVILADDVPPELVTVASRCVEVAFPPVPATTVASWLVSREADPERARMVAEAAGGDLDRARLLAEDAAFAERVAMWRSVPVRLDGHGAAAGSLARELLTEVDRALEPLRSEHAAELRALADQAEATGERGVPGRREVVERQHREERRWRTDELRAGLGILARAYRDRLADTVSAPPAGPNADTARRREQARRYEGAVGVVSEAAASLVRNPQETLLLEALFVRLGRLGN